MKVTVGIYIIVLFVFVLFAIISSPVRANENWVCENGGSSLSDFIRSADALETRYWSKIEGSGTFQNVFLIYEDGSAGVFLFANQCAFIKRKVPAIALINLFGLDIKQIFPTLKKDSF